MEEKEGGKKTTVHYSVLLRELHADIMKKKKKRLQNIEYDETAGLQGIELLFLVMTSTQFGCNGQCGRAGYGLCGRAGYGG